MIFSEASIEDIVPMHLVRIAVTENILPDPTLITVNDYEEFLFHRGKGWICKIEDKVVGFAIVDLAGNNIWALFVQPGYERQGIGRQLHHIMMDWYFSQTGKTIWLGTSPGTRAERFYQQAGWKRTGMRPNGEIRFEMTEADWKR